MANFTKKQIEVSKPSEESAYRNVKQMLAKNSGLRLGKEVSEELAVKVINEGVTTEEYWIDIEGEDGNEVLEVYFEGEQYFVLFASGTTSIWQVFALNAI